MRQAFLCAGWNLKSLAKNPRTCLCCVMGFLLCFLLTDKTVSLSREFMTNVQVFEPFVWCFADSDSILFAALVLMLVMTELPRLDASAAQLMFRTNKASWLVGQVVTVLAVSFGYALFLLLSSMLLCAGTAYFANRWSETATLLSFSPDTFEVALKVVRKTVKLTTPYSCALNVSLLIASYALLLSLIQLAFTVLKSKKTGVTAVLAVNICAYLLTPDRFMTWFQLDTNMRYYANLLAAWLSPLQHATYTMHNFGYDLLPTLATTYALMGGLGIALGVLAYVAIQKRDIDFTGGNDHE